MLELLLTLATPRRYCKQQARALFKALSSLRGCLEVAPKVLAGGVWGGSQEHHDHGPLGRAGLPDFSPRRGRPGDGHR
ncbi:hypothetical protein DFAR_2760004 [Desulfarculales bacterium]